MLAILAFAWEMSGPRGLVVAMDYPSSVRQGDTFDLVVELKNEGRKDLEIEQIWIGESSTSFFSTGFDIVSTDPELHERHELLNKKYFEYMMTIPPGEERVVQFVMRAKTPGTWDGEVTVSDGMFLAKEPFRWMTLPLEEEAE